MPRGKDWDAFLHNAENKTELIKFMVTYFKSDSVRSKLRIPLTVTEEQNTWLITQTKFEQLESCNHHEADTRLVLHASKCEGSVVIKASDTDVLILLSYAYSVCKPPQDWFMKIDHRYVSVKKLTTHFGDEVCQTLPAYHSITGCDTTSFPFRIGKIKPLKKMLKQEKSHLLSQLGRSNQSFQDATSAKCFFRTCMYSGSEQESFVETRIRTYNTQKVKSSSSILPDESSTNEHLKRSDLQAWVWYQCLKQNIEYPSITDRGWENTDDGIRPIWFTCPQLPPSLSKKKSKKRQIQSLAEYDADLEDAVEERSQPSRKKRHRNTSRKHVQDSEVHCREREKQGIGGAEERAEESEVDEEYQGDGENSESTMEQLSSDTCGLYSDFQSEESDLDLDLSN
uniref:uncharacterized protein n=1 Tax=Myxine glutinosa TaxID=7769 RepID=UPI00358E375C